MEMFEQGLRPGSGMRSATSNVTGMWSLEIRFPILSSLSAVLQMEPDS